MNRCFACLLLLAAAFFACSPIPADVLTISDGTATFAYDADNSNIGNANLISASDILFQETWFLRNNHPLLGEVTSELTGGTAMDSGNAGWLTFSGVGGGINTTGFDVTLSYEVNDVGGAATLDYSAAITNTNQFTEIITLYNYFDHDLNGSSSDSANYVPGRIDVSDAGGISTFREFTHVDHWQISDYSDDLDGNLRIEAITTLSDNGPAFGPGDFTAALQWDLTLLAGETTVVHGTVGVPMNSIPEPAGGVLLAAGTLLICLRRRRR